MPLYPRETTINNITEEYITQNITNNYPVSDLLIDVESLSISLTENQVLTTELLPINKLCLLLKISISEPCDLRIRCYANSVYQLADIDRVINGVLPADNGMFFDAAFSLEIPTILIPRSIVIGVVDAPITLTNLSASPINTTLLFHHINLGA